MSSQNSKPVIIKARATSANLGPGFDCLGIAWELCNTIEFDECGMLFIEGCEERFLNDGNLAVRAFKSTLNQCGIPFTGVSIRFDETNIPISRGLGSSSALIVAGIRGANELYRIGMSKDEMFELASVLEGHPDNVAPAIYGGLTASLLKDGKAVKAQFPVSDSLHFTALIPDFELQTSLARSVLPENISRQDAVFCTARVAMLLKAMETGDLELLKIALEDRLHEPYRCKLIPGYEEIKSQVDAQGACLCISGAGPTLLVISDQADFRLDTNWKIQPLQRWTAE